MSQPPTCDLVLLSWNHLEQTRPCLETLFATTRVPSRLLIVDNGSAPDVRAFLRAVKPQGAVSEVVLLQNEQNEGFPRGMNRGIQTSTAPFVCLLNNDLRFTDGWLEEMLHVAQADPSIGVVNPGSNTFGNRPAAGTSLQAHAQQMRQRHGRYTEVGMCIGFCMLIPRGVLERVGGLTEEVERAFFEDEDFCMRAQQAGYLCVVAEGAYVHHAEHQSVKDVPEREALFSRNKRWCEEKWGRRLRIVWPHFEPVVPGSAELRRYLERLVRWARRRTYAYVYCPMPKRLDAEALFRSVGLVPHSDVIWRAVPSACPRWSAAGQILLRRKKPFDIITAPDARWQRGMEQWRWWHRAAVIAADHEDQLADTWKQKSRSPSSS